jgi:hypothetical protein
MVSLLTGVLLILFFPAFGLRCAFPTFYSGTVARILEALCNQLKTRRYHTKGREFN